MASSKSAARPRGTRPGALVAELRDRCERLRDQMVARGTASEEHLAEVWPGDQERDVMCWILAYGDLRALFASTITSPASPRIDTHAESLALDALRGEPLAVTLVAPIGKSERDSVHVYPKGMNAIVGLAKRDVGLQMLRLALAAQQDAQLDAPTAERVRTIETLVGEIERQQRICVAVACSPGPRLPYSAAKAKRYEPPSWTKDLTPVDILLILRAYHEVNAHRINALRHLVDVDTSASNREPSWAVYYGNAATTLQVRPEDLFDRWTVAAVVAAGYASAGVQSEHLKAAEAKAKRAA